MTEEQCKYLLSHLYPEDNDWIVHIRGETVHFEGAKSAWGHYTLEEMRKMHLELMDANNRGSRVGRDLGIV